MRKIAKYSSLNSTLYSFIIVAIKSLGIFGATTLKFIRDLGRRIALQSGVSLAAPCLNVILRLAIAVQKGNAASIIGTMGLLVDWLSSFVCVCVLFHCLFLLVFVSTTWKQTVSAKTKNEEQILKIYILFLLFIKINNVVCIHVSFFVLSANLQTEKYLHNYQKAAYYY